MTPEERLKNYLAMVEVSRKWVTVMDNKAAFISAMNAALLAFLWTGAKLASEGELNTMGGQIASVLSLLSLLAAIRIVIPRGSLKAVFSKTSRYTPGFKAISFYGYVAANYPQGKDKEFFADVDAMTFEVLAREALEQHFTICHVVRQKELWVLISGRFLIWAIAITGIALYLKAWGY